MTQPGPTIPVILDVDTGVDDACALLFAARHPDLDLRAVTCVAGNADVDQVVRNTLTVLDVAGAFEVPVARGADRPLLEPPGMPATSTATTVWRTWAGRADTPRALWRPTRSSCCARP